MTKEKISKIISVQSKILNFCLRYKDLYPMECFTEYIKLTNEYIRECDRKIERYEKYFEIFLDTLDSHESAKDINKIYEQLNNCIRKEYNCSKCEYNGLDQCTHELLENARGILKMFIELKNKSKREY